MEFVIVDTTVQIIQLLVVYTYVKYCASRDVVEYVIPCVIVYVIPCVTVYVIPCVTVYVMPCVTEVRVAIIMR